MLPSLFPVILAALSLGAIPEAARTTERMKRALAVYDSQDDSPLVVASPKPVSFARMCQDLATAVTVMGPAIFALATFSLEVGTVGTFIRTHAADNILGGLLYGTLKISRRIGESHVSRSDGQLHDFIVVPCGENRKRTVPFASISLTLPIACANWTVHGGLLATIALTSILYSWPSRSVAAGVLCFYIFCIQMSSPVFDRRDGTAAYWTIALRTLVISIALATNGYLNSTGNGLEAVAIPPPSSEAIQSPLAVWIRKLVEDKPIGDLMELIATFLCVWGNYSAAVLTILAYRYDVSQISSSDCSVASEGTTAQQVVEKSDESMHYATMEPTFLSTLSSDAVDVHGRRPVASALMNNPRHSIRQLPTFTASLFSLSAVNIVVLFANIVLPVTSGSGGVGFLRTANGYKFWSGYALCLSGPVVVSFALLSAWLFSPGGLGGLKGYSEDWARPMDAKNNEDTANSKSP